MPDSTRKIKSAEHKLEFLFHPRAIALVGVPNDPTSPFAQLFLGPLVDFGFQGQIYPVNPKGGEMDGFKVYPCLEDIPGPVDYVIASLPSRLGPQLVQDSIAKGVKAVHFFTAGFSESGDEEGMALEAEIVRIARRGGVRLIGPNCMGIYCPKSHLSYFREFPRESGAIAFLCQSGGNSIHLVQMGAARGLRFSKVASYGNAADLNESDFLEYCLEDSDTRIIAIYIEGVKDGQRFVETLGRVARVKPVILLKGGVVEAGNRAVASHTGALGGSNAAWDALCRQLGVLRVYSLEELADMLVTFSFLPLPGGRNVAIFGIGGGAGVLGADTCEINGLVVPPLAPEIRRRISEFTPNAGNIVTNPIDSQLVMWGPSQFVNTIKIVSGSRGIDLLMANLISTDIFLPRTAQLDMYNLMARTMLEASKASSKPMAVVVQPGIRPEMTKDAFWIQQEFVSAGFAVYHSVAQAANAISKYIQYRSDRGE